MTEDEMLDGISDWMDMRLIAKLLIFNKSLVKHYGGSTE